MENKINKIPAPIKQLLKMTAILLGSIFLGTILLTLVYLLPTKGMLTHVESSIAVFYTESVYPQQSAGYKLSQLDNETDAIMLLNSIYQRDEGPMVTAMKVPRIDYGNGYTGCAELIDYLWLHKEPTGVTEYSRYWHGYLLLLKPLLFLMDYSDIRILNMITQLLLLTLVIVSMMQKGRKECVMPFIVSVAILNPVAIAMSLQFSSMYYVMLLSTLFILNSKKAYNPTTLMLIIGISTAFFDFLTYPVLTCGIAAALLLVTQENILKLKEKIFSIIKWGLAWAMGYAGMWAGKWLIYAVITRQNNLSSVLTHLSLHTADAEVMGESLNIIQVILKNIRVLTKWPYLFLFIFVIVFFAVRKSFAGKISNIIPYILIAMVPLLWFSVLKSHSGWLYWFTYRGLAVSSFSILVGLNMILKDKQKKNERHGC